MHLHVHIIALNSLVGGISIVADACSYTFDFIGRNACSYAAAAYDYAAFRLSGRNGKGQLLRKVGIIVLGIVFNVAQIHYFVALFGKEIYNNYSEFITPVVGSNSNFQF